MASEMPAADITLEQLETDPHPVLAQLRPLAWVPVLNGWLVTGRDLSLQVMRDAETFSVDDPLFPYTTLFRSRACCPATETNTLGIAIRSPTRCGSLRFETGSLRSSRPRSTR